MIYCLFELLSGVLVSKGVELLRASLDSNKVLTDMFYYKLDLSTKPGIAGMF